MTHRIGILGGAFNPPTLGHIELAKAVLQSGEVDEIYLNPCTVHSFGKDMVSYEQRVEMCRLAAEGDMHISVFQYEGTHDMLSGKSYDFLTSLLGNWRYAGKSFKFIIGQDNADEIEKWYRYEEVIKMIPFIVVPRKGCGKPKKTWYKEKPHTFLSRLKNAPQEVSSTEIRTYLSTIHRRFKDLIRRGLTGKIDLGVLDYIFKQDLYRKSS